MAAYESRFVSLCNFTGNMFQTEERKARMFMRGLRPHIRRYLVSQSFRTLREVADAAIAQELEFLATKDSEVVTEAAGKDKRKCKRSFGAVEQQAPQQRGPIAQRFLGSCYNCGRKGHKSFICRLPLAGPNSPGSYFCPPQQAQAQGHYSDFIPERRGPDR